jgi:uncharacterized protein
MPDSPGVDLLKQQINTWVAEQVADYAYSMKASGRVRAPKVIRDAVWDYHRFQPYEVHLLNSPFLQRLRGISQTSLASYTYPSATHNRFQHTLGTVMVLDRLTSAVENNEATNVTNVLSENKKELRLTAMLHDVGHSLFSHASEEFYGRSDPALAEYKAQLGVDGAAPHELVGHLIITSDAFRKFFRDVLVLYPEAACSASLDRVADAIIGKTDPAFPYWYLGQFINGVFDVDKLDYVARDAHSSGLKLVVDLDRLAYTMRIQEWGGNFHLAVDITGTPVIEQIIFNKMLLTSSVYHHHKVRAANCMLWGLFELSAMENRVCRFESVVDFLSAREADCLHTSATAGEYGRMAHGLGTRRLLKRALVISRGTIVDPTGVTEFKNLIKAMRTPEYVSLLRTLLFDQVKSKNLDGGYPREYFWWDFPKPPRFQEPSQCLVALPDGVCLLEELFNLDDWSKAYTDNNLKAHVFCPADLDRSGIAVIAKDIFEQVAGVKLNRQAISLAKIQA